MVTRDEGGRQRPARRTPEERLRTENARLRAEVRALKAAAEKARARAERKGREAADATTPALPAPDAEGHYPAEETLAAILARQIVRRRRQAGWTQAELAGRAGVRQETVSRIESGKNIPNVATVDRIDRALKVVGA